MAASPTASVPATLAARSPSESAAEVLTGYGRRSSRETKAVADRCEVCEQMPGFEAALAYADMELGFAHCGASLSI